MKEGGVMTIDQQAYNEQMISEFRATREQPDGPFPGRPLLLLTTTGAKSGLARTSPLMYVTVDDKLLIIGSNMGGPKHPDWCRNLMANPLVTIEIGKETYEATATVISGAQRAQLWAAITTQFPFFVEHQAKTEREIPVILIERR
jgi:deazaflavin-dependent oxidoreductase (nitroreductase family)